MLCAVLAAGASGSLFADDSIHFLESYAGAHPQEFSDLLAQVKSIVPSALAYITQQWRLPNTLHNPIVVRITDNGSTIPGRPVSAYVRTVRAGDVVRQELVVDLTHHLMYPQENLEAVLYHEMAHVVLQDGVTSAAAAGIPQWFNEGLAQTATTEGHDRTVADFQRYGHTEIHEVLCDLNGNVDEFYHGEYNFGCYTQYYLAVRRLTAKGGKDAIAKLINGLHSGVPLPTLIAQTTSLDWPAFQRDVAQYTRDVFNSKEPIP
jgi:hypothetical protein